jgi:hypothetical protein
MSSKSFVHQNPITFENQERIIKLTRMDHFGQLIIQTTEEQLICLSKYFGHHQMSHED